MSNSKDIELIQKYHSGELSSSEQATFDIRMESDSEFKELYSNMMDSDALLKYRELLNVKAELDKFDYTQLPETSDSSWGRVAISAIVGTIVVGGGLLYYIQSDSNQPQKIDSPETVVIMDKNSSEVNEDKIQPIVTKAKKEKEYKKEAIEKGRKETVSDVVFSEVIASEKSNEKEKGDHEVITSSGKSSVKEEAASVKNNCDGGIPKVDYVTKASCENESDGSIAVRKISGEHAPYSIVHNGTKHKDKFKLDDLAAGKYSLVIVDNRACEVKLNVEVASLKCDDGSAVSKDKPATKDYNIYLPDQTWTVPLEQQQGWLEIVNQKGQVIFNKKVEKGYNDEWNGYSEQGSEVAPGIYFYRIKDENGRLECTGSITIIK